MPRPKRRHRVPKDPQPSSSRAVPPNPNYQAPHPDDDSGEDFSRNLDHLAWTRSPEASWNPGFRPELGRRGHNFRENVVKGKARAHFGDVYNIHQTQSPAVGSDNQNRHDVLEELSFRGMNDRLASVCPAFPRTCRWMLDQPEYLSWRDAEQRHLHRGVLWIKGNAGTGKSTLMRFLHDTQEQHLGELVVSFFFNAQSSDALAKSVEGMYRSLLHQVYSRFPHLMSTLLQRHVPSKQKQESWNTAILANSFRDAILGISGDERVTLFVDALDECTTEDMRRAIERFEEISESATIAGLPLFICLSSRHYPHITMEYHEALKLDDTPEHMRDIAQYIESKLTVPKAVKATFVSQISKRCSGVFLWVVLVVTRLREASDTGSTRSELYNVLNSVPDQLKDLFSRMLESADGSLVALVQWVLYSRDALDPQQLYFAMQASTERFVSSCWDKEEIDVDGMRNHILHTSRGLVEFVRSTDLMALDDRETARFIHDSVREYFAMGGLALVDCSLKDNTEALSHAKLAEGCFHYIDRIFESSESCELHPRAHSLLTQQGSTSFDDMHPFALHAVRSALPHMEQAFVGGAISLDALESVPLQHALLVEQAVYSYYPGDYKVLKSEHPAALLYMLFRYDCDTLAKALLDYTPEESEHHFGHLQSSRMIMCNSLTVADLDANCGGGEGAALRLAIVGGNRYRVELLLDHGADINAEGHYRTPPIFAAVERNMTSMAQLLYDHGARIDTLATRTLLGQAVRVHDREIVQWLLEKGVDVNIRDDDNRTPLHYVSIKNSRWDVVPDARDIAIAQILVDAGADLEATDNDGKTVLLAAASQCQVDLVKFLLEKGASVHASRCNGHTAPFWVATEQFSMLGSFFEGGRPSYVSC